MYQVRCDIVKMHYIFSQFVWLEKCGMLINEKDECERKTNPSKMVIKYIKQTNHIEKTKMLFLGVIQINKSLNNKITLVGTLGNTRPVTNCLLCVKMG